MEFLCTGLKNLWKKGYNYRKHQDNTVYKRKSPLQGYSVSRIVVSQTNVSIIFNLL